MRKYLVPVFMYLSLTGAAQTVRYKDLMPTFFGMDREELKHTLKEYLAEDLDHPNANFRLALVYESNYKSADVLTRYEYVLANATEAKLRFTKAQQLVDEREVNRNTEYYFPIFKTYDAKGRPDVEFPIVAKKMANGIDSAALTLSKVPPIYTSFTRSVNFYDNAVKLFGAINNEFLSLDDLYLYFDADQDHRLGTLKLNFDSARFYFDRYMELTKSHPIPYHHQKYHVKPIVTYRLDGLITRMNFLTDDVEFWDYGAWVDFVRKSVSGEITSLRTRLSQNEVRLDDNLAKIAASNGEGVAPITLDKQLVFNLNNYDKQSLVLSILDFKILKQDWLLKTKTFLPDTLNLDRNATIYSLLIYSNRSADTLVNTVQTRATKDKIRKHADFIGQYYGGTEGLSKFIAGEKENIRVTYELYTGGLRSAVLNMATTTAAAGADKMLRFGKWNVPLNVRPTSPELLEKGDPLTLQSKRSPDGSIYLAGIYRPDKKTNNTVTYVARVNPDGRPGWMQSFTFKIDSLSAAPDANNFLGPFEITQEGCAFIVRTVKLDQSQSRNSFVYLNEKGEQKFRRKLEEMEYARKINFTEVSNSFVLLFKGQQENADFNARENLTLLCINALGDVLWKRQVGFAGVITDFINLIDGYLLVGNYVALKDINGREIKARAGESSPFLVRFNTKGDIQKIEPLTSPKPVYITNAIKVNDKSINLLGIEGNLELSAGKTLTPQDNPVHIMVDRQCQVICTNQSK